MRRMELSTRQIKYLFAIIAVSKNGEAKSVDIAQNLGVKKSSVSSMLSSLEKKGLITKAYYSKVRLTDFGLRIANEKYKKFHNLTVHFCNTLSLSEADAKRLAYLVIGNADDIDFTFTRPAV